VNIIDEAWDRPRRATAQPLKDAVMRAAFSMSAHAASDRERQDPRSSAGENEDHDQSPAKY